MVENELMPTPPQRIEPRWPAVLALLAVAGLRLALPEPLSAGPSWLLLAVVGLLLIPTIWSRRRGLDNLNKLLGYTLISIVTTEYDLVALLAHSRSAFA